MNKKIILLFWTVSQLILAHAQHKRPNILFILSDDHAYQAISAYGNKIVTTPNIDRIAKEGVLFSNALVANSICGPSRATLLTGKYSHENGYKANEEFFNTNQFLFPALLQQNGYQTAWIGKWHLGSLPRGFDYWKILPGQGDYYNPDFITQPNDTVRQDGYVTNIITDETLNWLKSRKADQPFFLVVGEKATHRGWLPDLQDLGAYDSIYFPLPATFYDNYKGRKAAAAQDMNIAHTLQLKQDLKVHASYDGPGAHPFYRRFTPEQERIFKGYYEGKISHEYDSAHYTGEALTKWKFERYLKDYYATAKSLDRNIGEILDYLHHAHLDSNTVVIYASDQGFYLGEHGWFDKRFIYDESAKTPFVLRYPGVVTPKSKIDQLVVNIDWAPTLLDIAGVPIPKEIQGASFLPLLKKNKHYQWRDAAYYHYYEYPGPHKVSPHFGIRTKDYLLVRFYQGTDAWELFDLKKDPEELNNVYEDKKYDKVRKKLTKRLHTLIQHYHDTDAALIVDKSK